MKGKTFFSEFASSGGVDSLGKDTACSDSADNHTAPNQQFNTAKQMKTWHWSQMRFPALTHSFALPMATLFLWSSSRSGGWVLTTEHIQHVPPAVQLTVSEH